MSIRNIDFRGRALIAVLGVCFAIFSVGLYRASRVRCWVETPPYGPQASFVIKCSPPVTVTPMPGSDFSVESLDGDRWIISPYADWSPSEKLRITFEEPALRIRTAVALTLPDIIPSVAVAEQVPHVPNLTRVFRLGDDPSKTTREIGLFRGVQDIRFDGRRFLYFLKPDTSQDDRPAVYRYDSLSGEQREYLPPPLGKDITSFVPSEYPGIYAWEEMAVKDGQRGVAFVDESEETVHLERIAPVSGSVFTSPLISHDLDTLLAIDQAHGTIVVFSMLDQYGVTTSPLSAGRMVGRGFLGEKNDVPAFWTENGYWKFVEKRWVFTPLKEIISIQSCQDGKEYALSVRAIHSDGKTLYASENEIKDLDVSDDCRIHVIEKDAAKGTETVVAIDKGMPHALYESKGTLRFADHD